MPGSDCTPNIGTKCCIRSCWALDPCVKTMQIIVYCIEVETRSESCFGKVLCNLQLLMYLICRYLSTRNTMPHVVDVDWRLDYYMKVPEVTNDTVVYTTCNVCRIISWRGSINLFMSSI